MVAGRRLRHWARETTRSVHTKKPYRSLRTPGRRFLKSVTALVTLEDRYQVYVALVELLLKLGKADDAFFYSENSALVPI
jgi:hypothetical protein